MDEDLKRELGLDENKPIPANFNIPYFIHADNMNKMDQSHKRVEKWLFVLCLLLLLALLGTNGAWIIYENSMQDVVITESTQDGGGTNIISSGDVSYGSESKNDKN